MYLIDSANNAGTIQAPAAAGAAGYFQDAGSPGTRVSADWLNVVQCELVNIILAGGGAPVKPANTNPADATRKQVLTAIQALIAAATPAVAAGVIQMTAAAAAPAGWLLCQGQAVSRATYAGLWVAMGSPNTGDGATTFNVPDFRGYFPRGFDAGAGVDPGRALLSDQADAYPAHAHRNGVGAGAGSEEPFIYGGTATDCPGDATLGQVHADNIASAVQGLTSSAGSGTETRPKNLAVNFIIKT